MTVGVVLVLAMSLVGATIALAFGATGLNDAREGGVEHAMTPLDSRTAMVALGDSVSQRLRLAATDSGGYHVNADAGRINVTHTDYDGNGSSEVIDNETLGAITHEHEEEHHADWEPKEFNTTTGYDQTTIGNLTNHYLSFMGPDVDLVVSDKNGGSLNEDASIGSFEQSGRSGQFITFLQITENGVRTEIE